MTNLDVALRALAHDLRADPAVPAAEIRRLGTRRRTRRQLGIGASATVAVAAFALAVGFHGSRDASPPAGPSPSTTAEAPTGFVRVHRDPSVFANDRGGSGLAGTDATGEATVVVQGACLALTGSGPLAPREGSREALPRVLVLPVGTTWLGQTGWVGKQPAVAGAARLTDGRLLGPGSQLTADFSLSPRDDETFTRDCPGTAGYAVIPTPADIVTIRPGSGTPSLSGGTQAHAVASAPPPGAALGATR